MFRTVMVFGMLFLAAVVIWFPGFLLGTNMVKAVSERKPTAGEIIMSIFPGFNLVVVRKQLYGSAKLAWFMVIQFVVCTIFRFMFFYFFNNEIGVIIALISYFVWLGSIFLTWILQGYILFDAGNMIQAGTLTKILAFICPPLSAYFIGRDCVPMMRMAMQGLEQDEDDDEEYYDDEDDEEE